MIEAKPSRTAYRVALRRAAHQLLDRPPILIDPLAITILRADDANALRSNPEQFEQGPISSYLRAFLAVRSRFAEDQLARVRSRGLRQYVLLGAGLDTFPYRAPSHDSRLHIWEVDHPATQAWKHERLQKANIEIPKNVTYVPVDFERDKLSSCLAQAGFDLNAGAIFAWLGVTPYLTEQAISDTLSFVATATASGGGIVFDYAISPDSLTPTQRRVYDAIAGRVAAVGEPFQSGFNPSQLANKIASLGFPVVNDFDQDALNTRYCANRNDGLQIGSLAHIMWAGKDDYGN